MQWLRAVDVHASNWHRAGILGKYEYPHGCGTSGILNCSAFVGASAPSTDLLGCEYLVIMTIGISLERGMIKRGGWGIQREGARWKPSE